MRFHPGLLVFLATTFASGLIFRSQLAGVDWGSLAGLDWRRAHSHMGFYGVLFPAAWLCWSAAGRWVPGGKELGGKGFTLYCVLVTLSFIGFLAEGYGKLATVASAAVLAQWLYFAWKNRMLPSLRSGRILEAVPLNLLLAACCIPVIAILSGREPTWVASVARLFMSLLLLGVFIPSALSMMSGARAVPSILWTVLPVVAAVDLAVDPEVAVSRIGTTGFGILIAITVGRKFGAKFPTAAEARWGLAAIGFLLQGFRIFPVSHSVAIAGIHYVVLGPVLLTVIEGAMRSALPMFAAVAYQAGLGLMIFAILLQRWFSSPVLQWSALIGGGILSIALVAMLVRGPSFGPRPLNTMGRPPL